MSFVCLSDKYLTEGEKLGRRRTARGSATVWRRLGVAAAIAALPLAAADVASAKAADPYSVLVFTKNATVGTAEGVAALQASAPPEASFDVSADAGKFTDAGLAPYKAVVFLNTTGDVLDAAQQSGVREVLPRRRRLPRHRLGDRDRARLAVLHRASSARARPASRREQQATIKVADRGHAAGGKVLPEYWRARTAGTTSPPTSAASRTSSRRSTRTTYTGGNTMALHDAADQRPPDRLVQGLPGRSLLLHRGRQHRRGVRRGAVPRAPRRRRPVGRAARPTRSTATAARPCSPTTSRPRSRPRRTSTSRSASTSSRTAASSDRPRRPGPPARPAKGTSQIIANVPVYTNSEDGLYGPAVDNNFATNKWVYLYYAPPTVRIKKCDGTMADVTTPTGSAPTVSADPCVWQDTWARLLPALALQVRRRRDAVAGPRVRAEDHAGPRQPRRVLPRRRRHRLRQEQHLWMVTGDDTPAGGGNSGGFGRRQRPEDLRDPDLARQRTPRAARFTLTFNGQTTAPIAVQRDRGADPDGARGAQQHRRRRHPRHRRPRQHGQRDGQLPRRLRASRTSSQITGSGQRLDGHTRRRSRPRPRRPPRATSTTRRTSTPAARRRTPTTCAARSCASRSRPTGRTRSRRATCSRSGTAKTRPEIYAMGFRNPYRIQVDSNDVAYITDYSPDSNVPAELPRPGRHRSRRDRAQAVQLRLAALLRRRTCPTTAGTSTPARRWTRRRRRTSAATRTAARRTRRAGCATAARRSTPGLEYAPPIVQPDLWYSYRDNTPGSLLGTPCLASYDGSNGTCPQLFPGAVHGRRRAARRGDVRVRPGQPEPEEVPALLRQARCSWASSARTRCARSSLDSAEQGVQDQPAAQLRRGAGQPHAAVRVRQPQRHAVRCRRGLLPADLR